MARSQRKVQEIARRFKSRHWGHEADRLIDQPDPDLPDYLVQMGVLVHLELWGRKSANHVDIDFSQEWKAGEQGQAHLAFAETKDERLYVLLSPKTEAMVRKHLLLPQKKAGATFMLLEDIASMAGGRQARFTYPKVEAVPLGPLYRILYYTMKIEGEEYKGQGGKALFDHQLAEEGGRYPILAVDDYGRLWICGGSYKVPPGGIQN